jgi:hypothetical protein
LPNPSSSGVDSASNRNEYQKISLEGGGGGKTLPAHKCDNLTANSTNFLENVGASTSHIIILVGLYSLL